MLKGFIFLFSYAMILSDISSEVFSERHIIDSEHLHRSQNVIEDKVDGKHHKKHSEKLLRRLPQALIIGAKKCGTRALLEFLRLHPDVVAPGPEPHFFDKNYEKGYHWYRKKMPLSNQNQLTIEKSPSYFITHDAPARVFKLSPNMKMILVVRDPITRAISDYAQGVSKQNNDKSFEEMVFINNRTKVINTKWGAIKIGIYEKHLENWLKRFPLAQIHIVNGESLIKKPASVIYDVQKFLGLSQYITEKHFVFNQMKGFPCLSKDGSGKHIHCLGKSKGRTHPYVSDWVMEKLRQFYEPFNQKFYQMTNIDFGWFH